MRKALLVLSLLGAVGTLHAQSNLCTVKIGAKAEGKRNVLLMGGNAYSLFEKYISEANSKGVKVNPRGVVVHVWDGSKMQSFELGWATVFSGEPAMQIWKKKLSGLEAKHNPQELKKAHDLGWDVVCIGMAQEKPQAKKGECSPEARSHINTGIGFVNNRQVDNAIKEFKEAIRLSPTCALAYANLVSAYVVKKDYNLAINTYREGLEKAGEDGFLHMTGAIAHTARKEFDLALVALDKALHKGYRNAEVLASKELKDLRTAKRKEFCDLMYKYSIPLRECIK